MSDKPEQFGNYLLLERLAVGGMAEVFLARAPSAAGIAKFVAIKRILPQFSDNPEFIDMFKDEAKIAVNLAHSNIVSINGFDIVNGRFFIVMDYVEGKNLRQILNKLKQNKGRFSVEQVVFMVKEVAAGLDNAHRCLDGSTGKPLNLTHRDMSPQNVMVSYEGEVKIVDFGIAKAETQIETTRAGTLKGKFGYMSPEQADGLPVDLRTDIFSLGIVLWELLANDRLFVANNEMNTLRKIRQCEIPSLLKIDPNIPLELERIAMKALAKDRNSRYQTASAMHRDLNRFLNRQYPDFSAQEFSMFIKTMYTEEILENRKKLSAYAQLPSVPTSYSNSSPSIPRAKSKPAEPPEFDDSTMVTEPTGTNGDLRYDRDNVDVSVESKIDFNTSAQNVLDDEKLNATIKRSGNDGKPFGLLTNPSVKIKKNDPPAKPAGKEKSPPIANHKGSAVSIPTLEIERPIKPKRRSPALPVPQSSSNGRITAKDEFEERSSGGFLGYFLIAAAFIMSYYWFKIAYPQQFAHVTSIFSLAYKTANNDPSAQQQIAEFSSEQTPTVQPPALENPPEPELLKEDQRSESTTPPSTGSADTASTGFLVITSQPSGAEVYVDGQSKGMITPARVEVPAQKPFSLELRKNSYERFANPRVRLDQLQSGALEIKMRRAQEGFIDVDVRPPGNARVTINGVQLGDKRLPITSYRIPANKEIVVRATNPINGQAAEKTVRVRADERVSLLLDLKNPEKSFKRVPANR